MASNYRLRRFSNPATLKAISRSLLLAFLDPYREFFAARGLTLAGDQIDLDLLTSILASPDAATPEAMLDALFFLDELAAPHAFDDLMTEAHAAGIDLGSGDEVTSADLAVRIWLSDPNIIERLHAERHLIRPKSFQSFLSTAQSLPNAPYPGDAVLHALESDLNNWFETKKRGRGTRVFPFARDNSMWFLVRHGEPYKREGTIKDGESAGVYYRPERFDVLVYDPAIGELAINARTKGEKEAYCRFFGKHIFRDEQFFDVGRMDGKFTLRPIVDDWRACLACSDIDGIEEIALTELQFRHDSSQYHVEVHKGDDVLAALDAIQRSIPAGAQLLRAGFKIKFENAIRPRTIVIRQPNITVFDRESDAEVLNRWLTRRGFIQLETSGYDVDADAQSVLAVH